MILCLKTDQPMAQLFLYNDDRQIAHVEWEAHRQLGVTLHQKIQDMLDGENAKIDELSKIVVYSGPGSFTGLRIGVSVANALAYSLEVPIVATTGDEWIEAGINDDISSFTPVSVHYGSDPHITAPKK